jgi:hypothetical protein
MKDIRVSLFPDKPPKEKKKKPNPHDHDQKNENNRGSENKACVMEKIVYE